ncbi:type III secretion system outer membrane ring subunit SctC [Pseudomonas sp. SDO528_S397]
MSTHPCRCSRLPRLLLCGLLLGSSPALSALYQARDESLHTFFTALSVSLGQPVVVSPAAARKRLSGAFEFDQAQQVLETVAREQGLIWYGDGQVLYLYDASEAKSSVVALRHLSVDRLRNLMRRSGLDETRHPLRESGGRVFYVSGPPNYVDHVLRLTQLMDRPRADLRTGAHTISVVQVLNTHVADRQYDLGKKTVTVPGMATLIEKLQVAGDVSLLAYPDTNSLLIKGKPEPVRVVERLVAELDVPKRAVEVSLWWVDMERAALAQLGLGDEPALAATRVLTQVADNAFMAQVGALERRRRAQVSRLPVILTQENVPAVFHDNQTFYLPRDQWQPVEHGTQVSVVPRFAEAGQIELLLDIEDGRPLDPAEGVALGRTGINTVVRAPAGRRLLVGVFAREAQGVRLFVIQARAVADDLPPGAAQAPPLTASQYERVKRAFKRVSEP